MSKPISGTCRDATGGIYCTTGHPLILNCKSMEALGKTSFCQRGLNVPNKLITTIQLIVAVVGFILFTYYSYKYNVDKENGGKFLFDFFVAAFGVAWIVFQATIGIARYADRGTCRGLIQDDIKNEKKAPATIVMTESTENKTVAENTKEEVEIKIDSGKQPSPENSYSSYESYDDIEV